MNMRETYNQINAIVPKTPLEVYARNRMLRLFPDPPSTGGYATYEEDGYARAYDIVCPDKDLDDYDHYREWLEENGIRQYAELEWRMERFKEIEIARKFLN